MLHTVFSSENMDFVLVSEELIPDYIVMVNDIERVERFIGEVHAPFTPEQERSWVQKKLAEKAVVFSMIEKESGGFIGNIELMDVSGAEAELGIAITAAKQDRGYGTEGIRRILEYGFRELGLTRIGLKAFAFNTRALHVYEKCGFRTYRRTEKDVYMEIIRQNAVRKEQET